MEKENTITDAILTKHATELMQLLNDFLKGDETLISYVSKVSQITQITFEKEFAAHGIPKYLLHQAASLAILGLSNTMASQVIKEFNKGIGNA